MCERTHAPKKDTDLELVKEIAKQQEGFGPSLHNNRLGEVATKAAALSKPPTSCDAAAVLAVELLHSPWSDDPSIQAAMAHFYVVCMSSAPLLICSVAPSSSTLWMCQRCKTESCIVQRSPVLSSGNRMEFPGVLENVTSEKGKLDFSCSAGFCLEELLWLFLVHRAEDMICIFVNQ